MVLIMEKQYELKPCPFCGGEATLKEETRCYGHGDYDKVVFVYCSNCGATGSNYSRRYRSGDIKQSAIEGWNIRKPMDKIVEQLEKEERRAVVNYHNLRGFKVPESYGQKIAFEKAIEIVKGGGSDESQSR